MGQKRNRDKPADWSEIVGMPDDWDKKNLTNLINKFKKTTFTFTDKEGKKRSVRGKDWIANEVKDAKDDHQLSGKGEIDNPYGTKVKDSGVRIGSAMPKPLWHQIEETYPTMFRDPKHYDWFMRNFKEFRVPYKW